VKSGAAIIKFNNFSIVRENSWQPYWQTMSE